MNNNLQIFHFFLIHDFIHQKKKKKIQSRQNRYFWIDSSPVTKRFFWINPRELKKKKKNSYTLKKE